jgi:hypothetical protein
MLDGAFEKVVDKGNQTYELHFKATKAR